MTLMSILAAVIMPAGAASALERTAISDLTHLSLEDLMNLRVEVTSAAKKAQALGTVAAAVWFCQLSGQLAESITGR